MSRVLIVENDEELVGYIEAHLLRENLQVSKAFTGRQCLAMVKESPPDLILLDIGLGDIDGFQVCTELRRFTEVPIIMVTARNEDEDKILGLGLGSDDYVVKPFNPKELMARVKRMLYRSSQNRETIVHQKVTFKELEIDVVRRLVRVGDQVVVLTPREYDLLVFLATHPQKLYTREDLLREVWQSLDHDVRSVDVLVRYLREKLKKPVSRYIQTVWGKGYRFADTV